MQTFAPAAPTRAAARPLTFEQKLALASLTMDERLGPAGIEIAIRTAHIEISEILVDPQSATTPAPRPATVDEVFAEAARLIQAHGWIRKYVGSAATSYCAIGAIRAAAGGNGRLEDEAETQLLARIRRQFPDALSVGQWNDAQSGPAPVLRMLG
ncbi:hypothetical protein [Streptomyces sp. NBC_00207]|uniref:DUF6197 family protein n=1 Tax=Streptomyces sp. NBC_00207 TaxID=2903635 RepID=UPI00324E8146